MRIDHLAPVKSRVKTAIAELLCAAGELYNAEFTVLKDGEVWERTVRFPQTKEGGAFKFVDGKLKQTHTVKNGKLVELSDAG